MAKKRIVFVDDEPHLLEALARMLRPERHQLDMSFAVGAQEALALMEAAHFDVVVTDMRMPGMDGASLLERVHALYPDTMRIILSGHFEASAGIRAAAVAHQFLAKPCSPATLKASLARASQTTSSALDEATKRVIGAVGALPSPSRTCVLLNKALANTQVSNQEIAGIISQDVAIAAKLLQLVNSAFFGLSQQVTDANEAVMLIGADRIRQLVMSADILSRFHPSNVLTGFSLATFEEHSQRTARIARHISPDRGIADLAAMTALLHDSGKLVLASGLPAKFERALKRSSQESLPLHDCEADEFGVTHAEIGAYLLNLWGLPSRAVEAIAWHHRVPDQARPAVFDLSAVVRLADLLANETPGAILSGTTWADSEDNLKYLQALGVADRLTGWRAFAGAVAGQDQTEAGRSDR